MVSHTNNSFHFWHIPPDPDLIDVTTKTWFDSLKPELRDVAQKMVQQLGRQPLSQRKGLIPNLLADEISRIEREKWQLVWPSDLLDANESTWAFVAVDCVERVKN